MITLKNCSVPRTLFPESHPLAQSPCDALNPVVVVDIVVSEGKIFTINLAENPTQETTDPQTFDLRGKILTTRFADAHVHLDKAHSWNRAPNRSGTFGEALVKLGGDKNNWTEEDLLHRAGFALESAYAHGTSAIRTHIDTWLPDAERSYRAMAQLREEWKGKIDLQTVSLCGVDQFAGPDAKALADLPLRYDSSAIGGMPLMNPQLDHQLDCLLTLAKEREVGIDLHVDESGDPGAACLRAVAEAVLRTEFPYPVVCGHCCSLAVQPESEQVETLRLVKKAGIKIISLPLCNLYLQDRMASGSESGFRKTPHWRGITLIRECQEAGITLACASDNIRDAFYAFGDLDPFEVYLTSVRLAHLDFDLESSLDVVTRSAADCMGISGHCEMEEGKPARFVSFEARTFSEWLSRPRGDRRLFERDQWIQPKLPDWSRLQPEI